MASILHIGGNSQWEIRGHLDRIVRDNIGVRFDPSPLCLITFKLIGHIPIYEREDDTLILEALRLMDRSHGDGVDIIRRSDASLLSFAVPPFEERSHIGGVSIAILQHEVLECGDIYGILAAQIRGKEL